jgi:hypothetical protein
VIAPGTCYAMHTNYGDARGEWLIYWRVRACIQGFTECHRFETRADGMYVMNPKEPVSTRLLELLIPIEDRAWQQAWGDWQNSVCEPWNVE